ncbi:MAG TPA: hypothetical protein VJQ25_07375, partial [Nitrospira sp.]|nr:hypothetical protein [Nitrospira sp.]
MIRKKRILIVLAALVSFFTSPIFAGQNIPDPLQPWTDWVLDGREGELCPFLNGEEGRALCRWSSPLVLSLEETKGTFSFEAQVFAGEWVALPGDADHWPQDVKAQGKPLAVVMREGHPEAFVSAGTYAITGGFYWDVFPESLAIPAEIGVVRLSVRGQPAGQIHRDEDGRLWLEARPVAESERDRIEKRIHRLLTDDVPFVMTTRITLDVSGKTRDFYLSS